MRIERIEPLEKGRALVVLEDGACLRVTERELLGLGPGEMLDEAALERLREAAGVSDAKLKAADLVGKRAMSRHELEKKLREKGASQAEARYAAEWMEAIGAIDDADYAALLARHCGQMGYGPARVREKLREKGIPKELWEDALAELPEEDGQIDAYLRAKLRGRRPDEREKRRLTAALRRRGFRWDGIKAAWARLGELSEDMEESQES